MWQNVYLYMVAQTSKYSCVKMVCIRQICFFTCVNVCTYNMQSTLSLKPLHNVTKRQHKYTYMYSLGERKGA